MGNDARVFVQMHFQSLREYPWVEHKLSVAEALDSFVSDFGVHVDVEYYVRYDSVRRQFFSFVSGFREVFEQEPIFDSVAELHSLDNHFDHEVFRDSLASFDLVSELLAELAVRLDEQRDNVFDSEVNHSCLTADSLANCRLSARRSAEHETRRLEPDVFGDCRVSAVNVRSHHEQLFFVFVCKEVQFVSVQRTKLCAHVRLRDVKR